MGQLAQRGSGGTEPFPSDADDGNRGRINNRLKQHLFDDKVQDQIGEGCGNPILSWNLHNGKPHSCGTQVDSDGSCCAVKYASS